MLPRYAALALLICFSADARLTRFVVETRETAGANEILRGHFEGEVDPRDPHNSIITDLALAPRNAGGRVEYSATFALLKPVDMSKSNHVLYYSVPNRGNGNVAAYDDGRVHVVSGWQGDVAPKAGLQTITVPVAKNPDGSSVTGPVIERLIDAKSLTLNTAPYVALFYQKPATLDTAKATLTVRTSQKDAPVAVPPADWAFADCASVPFPGTPDPTKICLRAGTSPAAEYVIQYTAKDPLVLGLGFAATRDLNSFLRYAERDDAGTANPVAKQIKWAISQGNSQSGNFIRSFIHLGFNQDEANRIVWDGANPHIAARQVALNIRFGVPGAAAGVYEPGSEGVVWWEDYEDTARHLPKAGLLDRCRASATCPKIVDTFGGLEFWYLRESPDLVGTDAKADIPLPSNVRRYFFPATSHGGGRGGFSQAVPRPPAGCLLPANPNPETETLRALQAALFEWVMKGVEPPPSRYPTLARGELVPPGSDSLYNPLPDYDFGPGFIAKDLSGVISKEPPSVRGTIPQLFPRVDRDGNELGGVPSVLRSAPLGTYLGWNAVAKGFDEGRICGLSGGYEPFAVTKEERVETHDPRPSLEERYKTHEGYVEAVKKAAEEAVRGRFLLREDADKLIAQAAAGDVLKQ